MNELQEYRQNLLQHAAVLIDELMETGLRIKEARWHTAGEGELTPHQALARLGAVYANMIAPSMMILLTDQQGELPSFDEHNWLAQDYLALENWFEIYEGFAGLFRQILEHIAPTDWEKTARHTSHGERTLQWWFELSLQEAEQTLVVLLQALES